MKYNNYIQMSDKETKLNEHANIRAIEEWNEPTHIGEPLFNN